MLHLHSSYAQVFRDLNWHCLCRCCRCACHQRFVRDDLWAAGLCHVRTEPITSVDATSADMLGELETNLHKAGIQLCFAEMKDPVKDKLKRFGLFSRLGEKRFFPTLGEAVSHYVKSESVEWVDWA